MAHFIASFSHNPGMIDTLQDCMSAVDQDIENKILHEVGSSTACAKGWDIKKPLSDIAINDPASGSWLLVCGTPILNNYKDDIPDRELLATFLADPKGFIREEIDSSFALLAYDAQKKLMYSASDYNRLVPLFYSVSAAGAYFASSELVLARGLNASIDISGFAQAVNLGSTWSDITRFEGINKLMPAEFLTIDEHMNVSRSAYWRPAEEQEWDIDFDSLVHKWGTLFAETISKFYSRTGDTTLYTDFTAGEDSRLVLAQCHALDIPYHARVWGMPGDTDTTIAMEASRKLNFPLTSLRKQLINDEQLLANALRICTRSDGYEPFFKACMRFATDSFENIPSDVICLGGVPGGGAFRGVYYLRAKLLRPTTRDRLDIGFFTKMKFLLDHQPGLLEIDDDKFLREINATVRASLDDVTNFTDGIKVDHITRMFQTCQMGLLYSHPIYQPFASADLTRSLYSIPAKYKQGCQMTRALTDRLYPELARIRTQNGVPTIRKDYRNTYLFLPEYLATLKKVYRGFITRILRVNQSTKSLPHHMRLDYNAGIFTTLASNSPYNDWFSSPSTMLTGSCYNTRQLQRLLDQAKKGTCNNLNLLARIINQELSYRWIRNEDV